MGTAAFAHSLARAGAPTGRLFTFDVDEGRLKKGKEELAQHGLDHLVSDEIGVSGEERQGHE